MNTTVSLNGFATFVCSVSQVQTNSYSLIGIEWIFNPTPESDDSNISVESFVNSKGIMDQVQYIDISILKIDEVDRTNEGTYYCIAMYSSGINITSEKANLQIKQDDGRY